MAQIEPAQDIHSSPPEKGHGRIEARTVTVWDDFQATDSEWEGLFSTLICVKRQRSRKNTKSKQWEITEETAWFLSTCPLNAQEAAEAIRGHWGIENRSHHVRDTAFAEDTSRIRKNPTIVARLRSFALNICRAHNAPNISLALYENALSLHNTLKLIGNSC